MPKGVIAYAGSNNLNVDEARELLAVEIVGADGGLPDGMVSAFSAIGVDLTVHGLQVDIRKFHAGAHNVSTFEVVVNANHNGSLVLNRDQFLLVLAKFMYWWLWPAALKPNSAHALAVKRAEVTTFDVEVVIAGVMSGISVDAEGIVQGSWSCSQDSLVGTSVK